jgi:hypothetical protein
MKIENKVREYIFNRKYLTEIIIGSSDKILKNKNKLSNLIF